MKKKILIIGINYYPEDSAIGLYSTQKAEYLVSKGFDVSVITGFPYYPQWKISEGYMQKPYFFKEKINGVKVYRSKQYVPNNPTFVKRILHLTSFTFGNFFNLFRIKKPDIVVSIVPFTTSGLLGWFLKLIYGSKNWIHIQDFEFDAAIDSGLLSGKKKKLIGVLQKIEEFVLDRADIVSTISYGMMSKLKTKTKTESFYLTNWIDCRNFNERDLSTHEYLQSDKFKILYSGNIGAKQDWDFFFEFLEYLKALMDIEVIVVGEGAEKDKVLKGICKYDFVKHFNLVPYNELSSLLSSADIHILFQKPEVIDTVMPSKILGMMASGKPSVVTGNVKSEVLQVFKDSNGGFYFDGKSIVEIIDCIKQLMANRGLCYQLGLNANKYVTEKFSKEKILDNFIGALKNLN
ncbi:WcaI family glycosyltransferase [Seonamhaeicola marinus]|uniref:Colanic acid biosynthesis glycosyltransferase WcaI n=1 Tax=Seonamhaeicola marinus TaxID=1912246 RepID=A0A5D0HRY6_9FLAO|nr:WcaI family glycosyltransferase [Seonamhaeicola marinus]TYA74123.1 colanic acid biosynthesis glycosyltransferase WcaI [Seonamhaeicola marinus]